MGIHRVGINDPIRHRLVDRFANLQYLLDLLDHSLPSQTRSSKNTRLVFVQTSSQCVQRTSKPNDFAGLTDQVAILRRQNRTAPKRDDLVGGIRNLKDRLTLDSTKLTFATPLEEVRNRLAKLLFYQPIGVYALKPQERSDLRSQCAFSAPTVADQIEIRLANHLQHPRSGN